MPKRILFLNNTSDLYGASKVALETVKVLKRNGYHVVFAISDFGPICKALDELSCPYEIIPLATIRRKYFSPKGVINRAVSFVKSWNAIKRICKEHSIDTIYSNTTALVIGAFFSSRKKLNHIWHVHEISVGPKWLQRIYAKLLWRKTDLVIAVSEAVLNHWKKLEIRIPIKRIYNGFDFSHFTLEKSSLRSELGLSENDVIIGMLARVHFWKGQQYFLDIAKYLNTQGHQVKFVMVGDAYPGYEYLYDEIKNKIEENGLSGLVCNLGFRSDIANILQGYDIFILPSILPDPLPTTVLEAMGAETAVVATAHGGASEMVVDQKTGLLIPWDDAKHAANLISPLIEGKELRVRFGSEGRERVIKHFSLIEFEKNLIGAMKNV